MQKTKAERRATQAEQVNQYLQEAKRELEYQLTAETAKARSLEEQLARRDLQIGTLIELLAEQSRALSRAAQGQSRPDGTKEPNWAAPARELIGVFCETIKAITPRAVGFGPVGSPQKS